MNSTVYVNDTYLPYWEITQPTQIFFGGSSSGKSYFLAQRAVVENMSGTNYLIVRNTAKTIRQSVFNEIVKAIQNLNVEPNYRINRSDMAVTFLPNGKQILFAGLDDVEKLKSITPIRGVLETIWIEEATEISYESYKQLTKRLRGKSDKSKKVVLSFNPILQTHWIYKEFFMYWEDDKTVFENDKLFILKTTYRDNQFLTADDIDSLENESDPYFYNVYTLGNWGILGKVIYRNWKVEDLSDKIPHFDHIFNGLDFGFSDDPMAYIRIHYDKSQKKIYVFDEFYRSGIFNDILAKELRKRIGREYITCDCENPQSIAELNRYGIRALAAKKGPDSVLHGIQWLQQHEIIIDVHCQNFRNEIQAYHWQEDKYGNAIQRPCDKNDHLLDALRYATENLQNAVELRAGRRPF